MPLMFRAITFYSLWQPAADQLRAAGYHQKSLRAILLTHSHWDHVSGLPDFPGVPVWVTPQERKFISEGGHGQFGKPFTGIQYEVYGFEGGPYLGFPCSHDVYGDGSIVVVPAPGHTPGGVIIFVTLHNGTRYAFCWRPRMAAGRNHAARGATLDHPEIGRLGCRGHTREPAADDRAQRTPARADHRTRARHACFCRTASAISQAVKPSLEAPA